uniref:Uncharacterized protein n=1 Tax=Nicotiana tabacum TaxID=4097 RepID=A0A1S4D4Z9_TOBAC|nr:PREDICTED: uncharacterized protein LOC107826028 [Nicotiana tabacum]
MTIVIEDDVRLASEVPRLVEADEGMSLPSVMTEAEEPAAGVSDHLRQEGPSTSQPDDDTSSPADGRGKGVAKDGYETDSEVDVTDLRMMKEGFTQLEVRLEGSTRTIVIPMDRDLLINTENVFPSLGPLCSDVEGETLRELDDITLSRGIVGLALMTMILEIEIARIEEKHKKIFEKLERKYFEYRGKYQEIRRHFG